MLFSFGFVQMLYLTTEPFDPEGILGTINSIVMGFLGMQVKCFSTSLFFKCSNYVVVITCFLLNR